jgi:hypothetical protein
MGIRCLRIFAACGTSRVTGSGAWPSTHTATNGTSRPSSRAAKRLERRRKVSMSVRSICDEQSQGAAGPNIMLGLTEHNGTVKLEQRASGKMFTKILRNQYEYFTYKAN